jgi:hypothetical protein
MLNVVAIASTSIKILPFSEFSYAEWLIAHAEKNSVENLYLPCILNLATVQLIISCLMK